MSEVEPETQFPEPTTGLSQQDSTVLQTVVSELDADAETLEVYEGATTGSLYAAIENGYRRASVTSNGLEISSVTTPDEDLEPVARIEPDPGETVEDAVNTLSFAGD